MKNTKLIIDIHRLVPKEWEVKEIDENIIKIFYIVKGRGNDPKAVYLPKIITIDQEFVEAIAMYIGDGKLSSDIWHLDFTSKDVDMVKFMLDFFTNRMNLSLSEIRYSLTYNNKTRGLVKKWAEYLDIPTTLINLRQSSRHREPCFGMQISSIILRLILGRIVDLVLRIDFVSNIHLRRAFLRGLFAAEGGIAVSRKENYIVYIAYHLSLQKEKELADLVQRLLKIEGISSKQVLRESKGERYIRITNWKNYHKLWKIDLFRRSQRKEFLFLSKLKGTKFSCKLNQKILPRLFNIPYFSYRQLAFFVGCYPSMFNSALTKNKEHLNIEYLINLSKIASVSLDEIKMNIIEFRVNKITSIDDKEFINFIFNLKAQL